jgi:molecular chaperone DnaJ
VSEWQQRPSNYYRVLDVDRTSTAAELKKAYRDATLKYHPDKVRGTPRAQDAFERSA